MTKPTFHMKIGADPPMRIAAIVQEISELAGDAIPDVVKRLDFMKSLRDEIKDRETAGDYAELEEWLTATVTELRREAKKLRSESQQVRLHRIYGYLAPAAIPLLIGLLNGTIRVG